MMLYGNYRFICRFESEAELPPYKGSTFRGAFGHALKRVVCALKRQECSDCILRERCLYTRVFETPLAQGGKESNRNSAIPHPFVIEPPPETRTRYAAGDGFECGLILFGEFNHMLPYFVYAFEQMGKIGLGRRINGSRGSFALQTVKSSQHVIYSIMDQKLKIDESAETLEVPIPCGLNSGQECVHIRLETPLRFKHEGRLSEGLPFHVLVRNMLRRASSLLETYGDGEPELDYRGIVERAGAVKVEASDLRWFDWERYSNKQERGMQLGGLAGTVTYKGKLDEFLPLLEFSEKVHIGKQTSFGLGLLTYEIVSGHLCPQQFEADQSAKDSEEK
jgi:hypothetical protein